jgi:ribosomal protein L37AE/L43A
MWSQMKYQCEKCSFHWEGTSYTFDKVREHEKTHVQKLESIRCKVCNARKLDQKNTNDQWECNVCGNQLNANGQVISS